ncbi:polymer-forming cytoskeletal protein [Halobacteria archaeon AArc-m2/3/4]|uniref:Polymer-forming cytoskeletal protein n=1 Tax=Natronoglomus mannanivorans TaxID=2979990 RepID=A0AAP2YXZ2_9EURY|nr:polymer-forming cytoskeletal protein [Halobacteria archaeon AArc-xg1-1]MCU4973306.1 polymer-forming cytoskeletal protein [Halobacteria archaeon AArc-m2/3/4]
MKIMGRGQSEILAIVLLLGIVLVSAVTVVVVGSSALTSIEDQSSIEQDRNEMRSVSHNIDNSIHSDGSFSLSNMEEEYEVTSGANVTISIGEREEITYDTGRLIHNDIIYEGGIIIDGGHMTSGPDHIHENQSTFIQLPALEYEKGDKFNGEINHLRTERPVPIHAETVEIVIESEYYEHWYNHFEDLNANVTKDESAKAVHVLFDHGQNSTTDYSMNLGLSNENSIKWNDFPNFHMDSYDSTKGPYDENTNKNDDAIVAVDAAISGGGQGSVLDGTLLSSGNINTHPNFQVNEERPNEHIDSPVPTTSLMRTSNGVQYEGGDFDGGIYYTEDKTPFNQDVISVNDNSVLIVDGDLELDDVEIEAFAGFEIHIHGSLTMTGTDTKVMTPNENAAERITFFVEENIIIEGDSGAGHGTGNGQPATGPEFTGLLHASNASVDLEGKLTVYGAMVVDDINGQQVNDHLNLHYDENLKGKSPYAASRHSGVGIYDPFAEYHGTEHSGDLDVTNWNQNENLLVNGDATIDGHSTVNGNLLVDGEALIENLNFNGGPRDLSVRDELTLRNGVVPGDLWVDDDAYLDGSTVRGDVFVDGDFNVSGGVLEGDVYVTGDVELNLDSNMHGEVHALGDVTISGEPVDSSVYVAGDANLNNSEIDGNLHAFGEITCSGDYIINGQIFTNSEENINNCDDTDIGTGDPIPPQVPTGPEPLDEPSIGNSSHYFDIRIAHLEVE